MKPVLSSVLLMTIVAAGIRPAFSDAALDYVTQAFAAEEKATKKGTQIQFRRGNKEMTSVIERILPDRLYVRTRDGSQEQEVIAIGKDLYHKERGEWRRSVMPPSSGHILFSVVDLFRSNLEGLVERQLITRDGVNYRTFLGKIEWSSGSKINRGQIELQVETPANLPRLVTFEGECASVRCSFKQDIYFNESIVIEQPI